MRRIWRGTGTAAGLKRPRKIPHPRCVPCRRKLQSALRAMVGGSFLKTLSLSARQGCSVMDVPDCEECFKTTRNPGAIGFRLAVVPFLLYATTRIIAQSFFKVGFGLPHGSKMASTDYVTRSIFLKTCQDYL